MFVTSTHISTLLRAAARAARTLPRAAKARALRAHDARLALKRVIHETFPSLSAPAHLLHALGPAPRVALEPALLRLGSQSYRPLSSHARLHAAGQAFRSAGPRLSSSMRGGGMVANVGLGGARSFASAAGSGPVSNAPMVLRAFASLLDEHDRKLPRATRYNPYNPRKRTSARRVRRVSESSSCDFSLYFPFSNPTVAIPPTADSLVTPGTTTTLSLPLSPSLSALLDPTPSVPYADAQIGIAVLSSLFSGVVSLHHAFSLHFADRILPLLARIDSMQLGHGARYEVVYENLEPDILRVVFIDRSAYDVRRLLGDKLGVDGWYALVEREMPCATTFSKAEECAIKGDWAEPELVMPVLDPHVDAWPSDDWPSLPSTTCSPSLDLSTGSSPQIASPSSYGSYASSLSASDISQMSTADWAVPPSQADSDVESAVELIGELSEVWDVEELVTDREYDYVWAGDGLGLAQPW